MPRPRKRPTQNTADNPADVPVAVAVGAGPFGPHDPHHPPGGGGGPFGPHDPHHPPGGGGGPFALHDPHHPPGGGGGPFGPHDPHHPPGGGGGPFAARVRRRPQGLALEAEAAPAREIAEGPAFGIPLRPTLAAGYLADRADPRDHGVSRLIAAGGKGKTSPGRLLDGFLSKPATLPKSHRIEVEKALGPCVSQWPFQSSTAHVVSSMAEYAFWQATGSVTRLSVLFLYKIARELMGMSSDSGATLRDTLKALRKYGCVPEVAWPRESRWLEELPRVRDMETARPCRGLEFCRLDPANQSGDLTLRVLLAVLAAGFPVGFGTTIYTGIEMLAGPDALIPEPGGESSVLGAQAFLATGYEITGRAGTTLKGRLKICGSWGTGWGQDGHAWLPFEYVTGQMARDFWVLCPIKKKKPSAPKNLRKTPGKKTS